MHCVTNKSSSMHKRCDGQAWGRGSRKGGIYIRLGLAAMRLWAMHAVVGHACGCGLCMRLLAMHVAAGHACSYVPYMRSSAVHATVGHTCSCRPHMRLWAMHAAFGGHICSCGPHMWLWAIHTTVGHDGSGLRTAAWGEQAPWWHHSAYKSRH